MSRFSGSDFDEFLKGEGIFAEVTATTRERLLTLQINNAASNMNEVQLDDLRSLLYETATWEAASSEDALRLERTQLKESVLRRALLISADI